MTTKIKNNITKFLIVALAAGIFAITQLAFAQSESADQAVPPPLTGADPAVTNLWVINSEPAPGGLVDVTAFIENKGYAGSVNNVLVIDYDQTGIYNIKLGDPASCVDDGDAISCYINTLNPGESRTFGFDGRIIPTAAVGTSFEIVGRVDAEGNDDPRNDSQRVSITVGTGVVGAGGGVGGVPGVIAPGDPGFHTAATLEEPLKSQGVTVFGVHGNPDWSADVLSTAALKFMIRGKEALAWSLGIESEGFDSPAIRSSYLKVLTIVNSLFIIGLLAIAAMWMFSLLIPRRTLRKVILIYGAAVIFVNFALPINQLFIDGSHLLQRTFLSGVDITNIVETPDYSDPNTVGFQNESGFINKTTSRNLSLNLGGAQPDALSAEGEGEVTMPPKDVVIGQVEAGITNPAFQAQGSITIGEGNEAQVISLNNVGLQALSNGLTLRLNTDQTIELVDQTPFNPNQEQNIFAFLMIGLTGLAYFLMALVFILRIVILWALLIVSPVLFVLAIFKTTRSYFVNWLGVYARWLLIGPLMALGIAIVVNIWQMTGLPIVSNYAGGSAFGNPSNIAFYLPGSSVANSLSTTSQMMEYLLFLVMLYLPIIFAFMLTRQKMWTQAASAIVEKREAAKAQSAIAVQTEEKTKEATEAGKTKTGFEALTGGIKDFLGSKFTGASINPVPEALKSRAPASGIESAHSYLPQHLALTGMSDMLGLAAGGAKGSRNAHQNAIERLANPQNIPDRAEREKIEAVHSEISERAGNADTEAMRIMSEIQEAKESAPAATTETTVASPAFAGQPIELHAAAPEAPNVTVTNQEKDVTKNVTPVTNQTQKTEKVSTDEEIDSGDEKDDSDGDVTDDVTENDENVTEEGDHERLSRHQQSNNQN